MEAVRRYTPTHFLATMEESMASVVEVERVPNPVWTRWQTCLAGNRRSTFLVVQPLTWSLLYNGCYSNFADRSIHRGTLTRPAVMLSRVPHSSSGSVSVNVKVLLMCCTLNVKLLSLAKRLTKYCM